MRGSLGLSPPSLVAYKLEVKVPATRGYRSELRFRAKTCDVHLVNDVWRSKSNSFCATRHKHTATDPIRRSLGGSSRGGAGARRRRAAAPSSRVSSTSVTPFACSRCRFRERDRDLLHHGRERVRVHAGNRLKHVLERECHDPCSGVPRIHRASCRRQSTRTRTLSIEPAQHAVDQKIGRLTMHRLLVLNGREHILLSNANAPPPTKWYALAPAKRGV